MAARSIEVTIPERMTSHDVAKTFSAYLLGACAFEMSPVSNTPPHKMDGMREGWQLDGSNDFWLTVDNNVARIGCRYDVEIPALEAMVALFKWRFERPRVFA